LEDHNQYCRFLQHERSSRLAISCYGAPVHNQISEFLAQHGLSFLGFEAEPQVIQLFERQFSPAAMADIQQWQAFEMANPLAFSRYMHVFSVRKNT